MDFFDLDPIYQNFSVAKGIFMVQETRLCIIQSTNFCIFAIESSAKKDVWGEKTFIVRRFAV